MSEIENTRCFDYGYCKRNAALKEQGFTLPSFTKTGTTIAGLVFKDGIIMAADSRATAGNLIADKLCVKLHPLTDSIFAAGAGTAADLQMVVKMLSSRMKLLELNTDRPARVVAACRMARQHLFQYQGYVSVYLIIGGIDFTGPSLYHIEAAGSSYKTQYLAEGSGSYTATTILERGFKVDMSEEAAVELISQAVTASMAADLNSGNSFNYAVITKQGTHFKTRLIPDFCVAPQREISYVPPPNTSKVVKRKVIKYDIVEDERMEIA